MQGITVAPHNTLQVSPSTFSIAVGVGQIVTVTARDASNNPVQNLAVSATSDNTAIANPALATGTGPYQVTVFGVANGTATITFTAGGVTATASVTVTTPPTNWADNLIGTTKVLMVDPGTVGSSQQRIEWSTIAQQALDAQWTYASNLPGTYPLLSGNSVSNSGYMQYYDGAINHWAFAKMKNEGASGTYKTRGDAIAAQYIAYATATSGYYGAAHHFFPETILANYLMYGDAASLQLINNFTRIWSGNGISGYLPDNIRGVATGGGTGVIAKSVPAGAIWEGRIMARYLLAALCMHKAGITSSQRCAVGGYVRTYASPLALARDYCAAAVEMQQADGSWNMGSSMWFGQYNFHASLLMDAMAKVDLYGGTTNYAAAITAGTNFLKNSMFNTGATYTGTYPNYGHGIASHSRDNTGVSTGTPGAAVVVPFSSGYPGVTAADVGLGNLHAVAFHRAGDDAFARKLLGTIQANAYGTSQPRYGCMAQASTSGITTAGSLLNNKSTNEFMWQAWEYMP